MPVKTKKIHHRNQHDKLGHRRSKKFLNVYAPYIPLLLIVISGLFLSFHSEVRSNTRDILGYATNTTDDGLLLATNEIREKSQLAPLQFSKSLDTAAQAKANDMAKRNYWSHDTPDGQEPWVFIEKSGYKYLRASENLAYGFDSSHSTLVGWMNSPEHKANVLDNGVTDIGFGIVNTPDFQGSGPQTIVVAMYAKPAPASPSAYSSQPVGSGLASVLPAQNEQKISYIQTLTGGVAPWSSFVVGLIVGLVAMYLGFKHTRRIHRMVLQGEHFVLHHPLLDITLVALLVVAAIAAQTAGTIH